MEQYILNLLNSIPKVHFILSNKYLFSLLTIAAFVLLSYIILLLTNIYFEKIAKHTKTKLDDLIFKHIRWPAFFLLGFYGVRLAILNLNLSSPSLLKLINSILALIFSIVILKVFDVILEYWILNNKKNQSSVREMILPLFHKVTKAIFGAIAVIWILSIWGVDVTPYLAGVGIGGIILGLALQDTFKNIFGGISIILDKTIQVGDRIKLDKGDTGTVTNVGIRSTKMLTADNEVVYVPNGYLANSVVLNSSRPDPNIRLSINIGVAYGTSVETVKKLVMEVLKNTKEVLKDPQPSILFLEMGDFALKYKVNFWVDNWDQRLAERKKSEVTESLYNALNKAGVEIPFPTRTVYLKKE